MSIEEKVIGKLVNRRDLEERSLTEFGFCAIHSSEISQADVLSTLELVLTASSINSISDEINKPYEDLDEAYELSLPHEPFSSQPSPGGKTALLSANTTLGLARGLQTFTQLVYHLQSNEDGDEVNYIPNSPLHIFDKPAFPHR